MRHGPPPDNVASLAVEAMSPMGTVDIEKVAAIIREVAEAEIMPRWKNLAHGDISEKSKPGDLVTVADRAAEAALERRLTELLAGSAVVGEETVFADPGVLARFSGDEPVWVLDPVDGTKAFTQGKPTFDVLVALVRGGTPVAGWIYAPAEADLYLGEVGGGVVRQRAGGDPVGLRVPARASLAELTGIAYVRGLRERGGLADPETALTRFKGTRPATCAGHNYASLLRGETDFLINFSTQPWDHMAGLALATAGGWHGARHDGRRFDPLDSKGGVLVAPGQHWWHEIRAALLPYASRNPAEAVR